MANLYQNKDANIRKTWLLVTMFFVMLVGFGWVISYAYNAPEILYIAVVLSIIMNVVAYWKSDKIALAMSCARPIEREGNEYIYRIIENLAITAGLPMPRLYLIDSPQINAFATGRDPKHAVICVTTGALAKLNKEELDGVLAHELSHVANYDMRFMTITAVLVGMVAIISEIFLRSLWMRGEGDNEKANAVLFIIGIVLAILAPIVVQLVQLAISRKREYTADANAVQFTRYPKGLINALKKIKGDYGNVKEKRVSKAVNPLFFAAPTRELLSTHPDINKRIEILERM